MVKSYQKRYIFQRHNVLVTMSISIPKISTQRLLWSTVLTESDISPFLHWCNLATLVTWHNLVTWLVLWNSLTSEPPFLSKDWMNFLGTLLCDALRHIDMLPSTWAELFEVEVRTEIRVITKLQINQIKYYHIGQNY